MPIEPVHLTDQDISIVRALQGDIPVCEAPFREIARELGLPEELVLNTILEMKSRGILRRFGATLRHQKVGFRANAMSAWQVVPDRIEHVGELLASSSHVTHCYERTPHDGWPYNLYAMIHARSPAECERIAEEIAQQTGVRQYILLFSSHEHKKESMRYF